MVNLFILLFAFTLISISVVNRSRSYANIVGFQGLLLFCISFFLLEDVTALNLFFITAETLLFKAIIVPWLMYRIINSTGSNRRDKSVIPGFYQLILTMGSLFVGMAIAFSLKDPAIEPSFLLISISALLTGMTLIISHKKVFPHMVGFLVIENAVFLFSIAAGTSMPMLINICVLIDLLMTTIILSVFLAKVTIKGNDSDILTQLKD